MKLALYWCDTGTLAGKEIGHISSELRDDLAHLCVPHDHQGIRDVYECNEVEAKHRQDVYTWWRWVSGIDMAGYKTNDQVGCCDCQHRCKEQIVVKSRPYVTVAFHSFLWYSS